MIEQRLSNLARLGRLLDEAVDIADRCDETLLGAQIAQALHTLDARVGGLLPPLREPGAVDRGGRERPSDL